MSTPPRSRASMIALSLVSLLLVMPLAVGPYLLLAAFTDPREPYEHTILGWLLLLLASLPGLALQGAGLWVLFKRGGRFLDRCSPAVRQRLLALTVPVAINVFVIWLPLPVMTLAALNVALDDEPPEAVAVVYERRRQRTKGSDHAELRRLDDGEELTVNVGLVRASVGEETTLYLHRGALFARWWSSDP